jgi:hypothetical protein
MREAVTVEVDAAPLRRHGRLWRSLLLVGGGTAGVAVILALSAAGGRPAIAAPAALPSLGSITTPTVTVVKSLLAPPPVTVPLAAGPVVPVIAPITNVLTRVPALVAPVAHAVAPVTADLIPVTKGLVPVTRGLVPVTRTPATGGAKSSPRPRVPAGGASAVRLRAGPLGLPSIRTVTARGATAPATPRHSGLGSSLPAINGSPLSPAPVSPAPGIPPMAGGSALSSGLANSPLWGALPGRGLLIAALLLLGSVFVVAKQPRLLFDPRYASPG